jgi:hypothetical protein
MHAYAMLIENGRRRQKAVVFPNFSINQKNEKILRVLTFAWCYREVFSSTDSISNKGTEGSLGN